MLENAKKNMSSIIPLPIPVCILNTSMTYNVKILHYNSTFVKGESTVLQYKNSDQVKKENTQKVEE